MNPQWRQTSPNTTFCSPKPRRHIGPGTDVATTPASDPLETMQSRLVFSRPSSGDPARRDRPSNMTCISFYAASRTAWHESASPVLQFCPKVAGYLPYCPSRVEHLFSAPVSQCSGSDLRREAPLSGQPTRLCPQREFCQPTSSGHKHLETRRPGLRCLLLSSPIQIGETMHRIVSHQDVPCRA
jgi:hypothetical protein